MADDVRRRCRCADEFLSWRVKNSNSALGTNSVEKWMVNSYAMWWTPTGVRYWDSSDSMYPVPMPIKYTAFTANRTQSRMHTAVIWSSCQ